MRAWFARFVPETIPAELLNAETDPVACLDSLAAKSSAKARLGLTMALNDTIESTSRWAPERVAAMDQSLERDGLPSLTQMRIRFSKAIQRVVARGTIKNDAEYYAVRNAVELVPEQQVDLLKLLAAYEKRVAG
jgi:hypothetical protein